VTYPCDGEDQPGHDIIFTDGFPTTTGRAKLVPTAVTPPDELPDDDFPLVLSTGRLLEHWHTGAMTRRAGTLDTLEPIPIASIHPEQMAALGLKAGDTARVESRRGTLDIQVRADREVPDGTVFIPFCFNEAAANLLTNPNLDPFGKIPEFKFCAVRVTASGSAVEAAE
jgi:formate dehydrogenase major subunit